jgi:mannose-6-phosphate isomerase-like protein (cupin superfamily)
MLIRKAADCAEVDSPDGCYIREVLQPPREAAGLGFSLALARLGPGERTHAHVLSHDEVYFLLEGEGRMHIGGESAPVAAEAAVFIPRGELQWIENTGVGDLRFLALVCPPWRREIDRRVG